ncbi:hypothetical protein JK359_31750 [Streptomyces actinomycinicus]|uniref:Secreted protein n=1 Tax=Streptomyces actinomycinicus TaxID=1695166 RepID=A0A937JS77_9ACTN|nr:hypothetical protein [Streptomyces actinomycinicus]MBL1086487.1 hypothetical protein [Streptomyces actinomycinicus]
MIKTRIKRISFLAVSAATAVVFAASPASAYTDIEVTDSAHTGTFWFHDDGDTFTVCDTKVDGAGVLGRLYYKPLLGDWYVTDHASDGGDSGCGHFAHDVNGVGDYQMKLYWMGPGYPKEIASSRVFNE